MSRELSQIPLVVDSTDRTDGTGPGRFSVNISGAVVPPTGAYISLMWASVPLFMLDFPSPVTFYWREQRVSPAASTNHTSTLEAGNYNAVTLAAALQEIFRNDGSYSNAYLVSWSELNGKLLVETQDTNILWGLGGSSANSARFLSAVGMTDAITADDRVESPYAPEFGPRHLTISVRNMALQSATSNSRGASGALAVVPIDGAPWSWMTYVPPVPIRYKVREQVDRLDIKITRDDTGEEIDLLGNEVKMLLLLEV